MSSDNRTGGVLGNVKFNTVGREEAAAEVLTQQIDPAVRMRNAMIIIAVIAALGIVFWIGFQRSGLRFDTKPKSSVPFAAPEPNIR